MHYACSIGLTLGRCCSIDLLSVLSFEVVWNLSLENSQIIILTVIYNPVSDFSDFQ